jgi:hypothetical protein
MTCTVTDFSKHAITYLIAGTTREELENRINLFFTSQNLASKKDTPQEKVFQRGNKVLRILLGVFVKYFRVVVTVNESQAGFVVTIRRDMNLVMSGGLAGMNASTKEFSRLNDEFKTYLSN